MISNPKIRDACNNARNVTGYRSAFEASVANDLQQLGHRFNYETARLVYTETHVYIPDFLLLDQCIVIEAKGLFDSVDRAKMLKVKKTYPDLDIRIVLQNPKIKLSKKSKTTYGDWCDKNGFIYSNKHIPEEWIKHTPTKEAREIFVRFCN